MFAKQADLENVFCETNANCVVVHSWVPSRAFLLGTDTTTGKDFSH
ncbi:MAG: hypothetical protein ACJAVI_005825 [Candidatus Azotimanducaceae bacterium]|jgi:hypothetical protein